MDNPMFPMMKRDGQMFIIGFLVCVVIILMIVCIWMA